MVRPWLSARRDYTAWAVMLFAAALSVIAYVVTQRSGGVLLYPDAKSHLAIARRVISSTSPGLAQLGNAWVPLPHLAMLPLVWSEALYHNGFAGSIVSMAAYVATAVLIYKITFGLTGTKTAAVTAAGVFALNVNMLYMQSTPMTEALLFCMLAATVYCIQQWAQTDRYQYLIAGGVAAGPLVAGVPVGGTGTAGAVVPEAGAAEPGSGTAPVGRGTVPVGGAGV